MSFKDQVKSKFYIGLSPMDGVTDVVFRQVQLSIAKPDVMFTEFVSAEGISRGGVKLYDQLLFSGAERPIVGQLFGKDPESFYKASIILCELGFDGIDINMGCPAKTVTQNGSGAALIGKPDLAIEIIKACERGIKDWLTTPDLISKISLNQKTLAVIKRNNSFSGFIKPSLVIEPSLSVKTRLGIDKPIVSEWIPKLLGQNLDFLTIHGRTLKQGYSGTADWQEIKKVVDLARNTSIKIWGNGDIKNVFETKDLQEKFGVSGVLIGRSCMGNPWAFNGHTPNARDKYSAMMYHAQIQQEIFPNRRFDCLRKHFLLYASDLPNAKQLRSKIITLNNLEELSRLEEAFLN